MRANKIFAVYNLIFRKNEVNIQNSRTVFNHSYSAEARFDAEAHAEHFVRVKTAFNKNNGVVKIVLFGITDRLRFVNRGAGNNRSFWNKILV